MQPILAQELMLSLGDLGALQLVVDRLLGLLRAFHAAPPRCRDRLVAAASFCAGTVEGRTMVLYLELAVIALIIVGAFWVGRLTAEQVLSCRSGRRHRVVLVGRPSTFRLSDDGGSSSAGSAGFPPTRISSSRNTEARALAAADVVERQGRQRCARDAGR